MSTFRVEVVPVVLEPHPNADSLSVARIFGFTCCVRSADWSGVSLGAYIPPDSLVDPERTEFAFLKDKAKAHTDGLVRARIKVAKLRGVVSQGLLLPAKPGWKAGDDVAAELGVTHYDPPVATWGPQAATDAESAPPGYFPVYDVENWRRYRTLFRAGEECVATEKIHGASARFSWVDDKLRVGSRTSWKKDDPRSPWWVAIHAQPEVAVFCANNPGLTVYGEIYGQVQDLRYGTKAGEVHIAAFDLLHGNEWVPHDEARRIGAGLPWVPEVYRGPYDEARIEALAEGPSLIPGAAHIREGVVVKPLAERTDLELGRVQLKIVANGYLQRGPIYLTPSPQAAKISP